VGCCGGGEPLVVGVVLPPSLPRYPRHRR
jgi:hypothetical protein